MAKSRHGRGGICPQQGEPSIGHAFSSAARKSRLGLPGMRDFDRPLDAVGHADAEAIGAAMRAAGYMPDMTLCSNARRARETLEGLAGHTDTGRVGFSTGSTARMRPAICTHP